MHDPRRLISQLLRATPTDVIILNEMDIGMARSDQQHTTRLLAHMLGMNYAWGLEFVELTRGNKQEQIAVGQLPNFHGLHGNAFLTRCSIYDPVVFRDPVGKYFTDERLGLNADGHEKRLGGRMGLFGRIQVNGRELVIGSTHTVRSVGARVRAYINGTDAITAGDQPSTSCSDFGLRSVDRQRNRGRGLFTWPASCKVLGNIRGDNFCSNLQVSTPDTVAFPCYKRFGLQVPLSDHAPITITLQLRTS